MANLSDTNISLLGEYIASVQEQFRMYTYIYFWPGYGVQIH